MPKTPNFLPGMTSEDVKPWPALPKECLEAIVRRGGPQVAASLSSTCKSWWNDLADDVIWRSWHGLPLLRYHSWQSSYGVHVCSLRCWLAGAEQAPAVVVPQAHERWLTSLDLSPTHVLSGSLDANVKYWDRSRPGTWVHYLRGHTGPVSSVRLAYDSASGTSMASLSSYSRAYSGSRDGTLRCWDLRTGTCVRAYTLEGGRQWVNTVAVWRPQQQQHLQQLMMSRGSAAEGPPDDLQGPADGAGPQADAAAGGAAAAGGGLFGALGGGAHGAIGAASPWAVSSPSSSEPPAGGPMAVVCGTSIGQLCLYDVRQSVPAQRLLDLGNQQPAGPPPGAVYGVAVYGDALAAACASGSILVWDLRAGAVRHRLDEHGSACTCVAMYGDTLVAGDLEDGGGGGRRFRGALSLAAAARRHQQAAAAAAAGSGSGTRGAASAAVAAAGGGGAVAAARVPVGPRWPCWRPHRRRPGLYDTGYGQSSSGDSSSSSSSGDSGDEAGDGGLRSRRRRGAGFDGAAAVAALEALADGRAPPPPPPPNGRRQAAAPSPLPRRGSPWLRDRPTAAAAGAAEGAAAAGGSRDGDLPRLRFVMRHTEWVRDVALVGPTLVLSCSKDGLVCLSRTDTMQVVAVWDVAAADAGAGAGDSSSLAPARGSGQVANQVHALAADEWGFVAGCQDASMRMWSFAPGGMLPERWAPPSGEGRGSAGLGNWLLSDMKAMSC
ncbi:Guanine nucleotide-binding protein subunit beta-2-like 1 [Pleodorina starrii]|nr:Guanine nucleotide-binding protein subunit beta-2-like 1 [Pleodorina starrii]